MTSPLPNPPRRPRILHCITHVSIGGAERVAVSIAEQLREEFDFSIFAVRGIGRGEVGQSLHRELLERNIPVLTGSRVPMRFGGMITGAFGLARAIRKTRADIVHLHTEIPEASGAAMRCGRGFDKNVSFVRTIHSAGYWEFWRRLGLWCDRRLATARIAAVSPSALDAFTRFRRESSAPPPPSAPVLIPNGVARATAIRSRNPSTSHVDLVYGGRLEHEKGVDLLPEILTRTQLPAGGTARLVVFGTGPYHAILADFARRAPQGWKIELHEPVADFRTRLADFDLMILPSRFEGLPLVAIEASMAALPIVTTNAPGVRDTMPTDHPWLAPPGDARSFAEVLTRAIHQRGEWQTVGARQKALAEERFTVEEMARGYRQLYRQIIACETAAAPA